jgi:hypothetical protein
MPPFHNLQATHNLSHAHLYMKLLYIELFERSLPAWVAVRITNGMALIYRRRALSLEKVEALLALLGGVMFGYRIASLSIHKSHTTEHRI